jgi:hypothetical protein
MNTQTMKRIYEIFAKKAVQIFNEEGVATPQLFLIFKADSDRPEFFGFPPEFVSVLLSTEEGKDNFKPFLQRVLADDGFHAHLASGGHPKPEIVVQISEAWISNLSGRDPNKVKVKPSSDPHRTEAILVALHSLDCTVIGLCPIFDEPTRHAEYRELEPETRNVGRLSLTTEQVLQ